MSTILKALRRLEHDKTSQLQRPLREEVADGAEPRRRFPVFWVVAAVFTAGIGIGAAALFLWPGRVLDLVPEAESQAAAQPAAPKAEQARPATAATQTRLERQRQRLAARAARRGAAETARVVPPAAAPRTAAGLQPAEDVAVLRQITPTPLRVSEAESAPGAPSGPGPGEVRPGAEAMKPKPRPATPPPSAVAAVAAQPRAPEPAEPEPRAARPASPTPPVAEASAPELPASEREIAPPPERSFSAREPEPARSPVPVILVSRTQWHPDPERREALIEVERDDGSEKLRVHEGDAVGNLVVERIEPSGVVFDYDGVELRHGVGSGP